VTVKKALTAVLLSLCACAPMATSGDGPFARDMLLGASMERALITQSTLFPYHFEAGAAELNGLGRRDLMVLAGHLRMHQGSLTVRRGAATPELHEQRVQAVLAALESAGVSRRAVTLRDGLPGGDGTPSARIVDVLARPLTLGAGSGASGASAGASVPDLMP
jgi:hypothetical protein